MRLKRLLASSLLALFLVAAVAWPGAAADTELVVKLKDGLEILVEIPVDPEAIESFHVGSTQFVAQEAGGALIARVGDEEIPAKAFYDSLVELAGRDVLMQLMAEAALRDAARARNVTVTEEDVVAELESIKSQLGPAFDQILIQYNMTEADLLHNIELSLLAVEIANAGREITDAEVEEDYNANIDVFSIPESVRASHILVETEEEVQAVLDALEEGQSFADLAMRYSIDTGSAVRGGDLGYFYRGDMVQEFEDVAFALEVGETSGAVKTDYGYHVIALTDRIPRKVDPLEEVREDVITMMRQQRTPEFGQLVSELLRTTPVTIYDERFQDLSNSLQP